MLQFTELATYILFYSTNYKTLLLTGYCQSLFGCPMRE